MALSRPLSRRLTFPAIAFLLLLACPVEAQTFPEPEQIEADVPDRAKRAATFEVLLMEVNHNGLSEAAAAKYSLGLSRADPPAAPDRIQFAKQ